MFLKIIFFVIMLITVSENLEDKTTCMCLNDGICSKNNSSFEQSCECKKNFYGKICEYQVCDETNNILVKQCKNGDCMKDTRNNNTFCYCKPTHTGALCEKSVCFDYCYNGGKCNPILVNSPNNNDYLNRNSSILLTCECQSDRFYGSRCQFDKCFDKSDSCPSNKFLSPNCECITGSDCDKAFCNDNGNCISQNNNITCICRSPFSGQNCQSNDCSKYCLNNGRCVINETSKLKTCECPTFFSGEKCEITIDSNIVYKARNSLRFIIYFLALTLLVCMITIGCCYSLQNGHLRHINIPNVGNLRQRVRNSHLVRGDFSFSKLDDEQIIVQNDHLQINA